MKKKKLFFVLMLLLVAFFARPASALEQEKEAYVVNNGEILSFYYDTQKAMRTGSVYGIDETKVENYWTMPVWGGTSGKTITLVVFDASFKDYCPKSTATWFKDLVELKKIEDFENLNTSEVTNMIGMFQNCSSLTSLDISNFDTKNVTNMKSMFAGCKSIALIIHLTERFT
ncbi:MAG: BspA family leucine-rich repeat surface protein [Prevotella sp.]|nr:BspA family leucine-rich repeat surface protein [Prevotella sp.]MDY4218577.1 BspA family leucine-rich repeat surface protein [Prevotella sp.]